MQAARSALRWLTCALVAIAPFGCGDATMPPLPAEPTRSDRAGCRSAADE